MRAMTTTAAARRWCRCRSVLATAAALAACGLMSPWGGTTRRALAEAGAPPAGDAGNAGDTEPASQAQRFTLGFELDANLRHSDDTKASFHLPYVQAQETVDP